MTVILATIRGLGVVVPPNPRMSEDLLHYEVDYWPTSATLSGSRVGGEPLSYPFPVEANPRVIGGAVRKFYSYDYYYRIHVIPPVTDVGNISSTQTRVIQLWNSFFVPKTINSFSRENDDGISLVEPVSIPYSLAPFEIIDYVLTVSTVGQANINASYNWSVDGKSYVARVIGNRTVLFPFAPNFDNDVNEVLEWKTEILRSKDGNEQRRALRIRARRNFDYKFQIDNATDGQILQNLMWGWQNRSFVLPVWTDKRRSSAPSSVGGYIVNVSTVNRSFLPGESAIFFKDFTNYEVVQIKNVNAGSLETVRPLEHTWPAGTRVYPVVLGHFPESVSVQRYTNRVLEGRVEFMTSPADSDPALPVAAAPIVYDSREVLLTQPNWDSALDDTFDFQFDTVDAGNGAIAWLTSEYFSRNTRRYSWLLGDRNEVKAFREFLRRRAGQLKPFWLPTWTEDFFITQNIGSVDVNVLATNNGFKKYVGVNTAHDRIMIKTRDGQMFFRRITAVEFALDGVNLVLTLDTALGVNITVAQVKVVHMLQLCRFATDKIQLQWKSEDVVVVSSTLTTVPA